MEERHRHRYEVNVDYVKALEAKGMRFVGHDTENVRMEVGWVGWHTKVVQEQSSNFSPLINLLY